MFNQAPILREVHSPAMRVAYVVKRYPRFSETFIVNEILALEAIDTHIEIFSLYNTTDTHFQDALSRVRAPVTCFALENLKGQVFWDNLNAAAKIVKNFWAKLAALQQEDSQVLHQAIQLAMAVRANNLNHIHAHFATTQTTVARLASYFADVPYTFTAHAKDIFHNTVDQKMFLKKLEDASKIITVSDYNLQHLREQYGPAAARVERIYNGLDLQRFAFSHDARKPTQIISVGRLVEKKGFAVLLEACAILKRNTVPFECQIIGTGPLEADLRQRIQHNNLEQEVQLLGPRPQSEVMNLMRQANIFVAPCVVANDGDRDGLPTVLLEAMALGAACVSTDVTGIPEIIHDQSTGLLVAQNNPQALADALTTLLTDQSLRTHLVTKARALVEQHFDVMNNANHLRQIFSQAKHVKQKELV